MRRLVYLLMAATAILGGGLPAVAQSPGQRGEATPAFNPASREAMAHDAIGPGNANPLPSFAPSHDRWPIQQVSAASPVNPADPAASVAEPERVARLEKQLEVQQKEMRVLEKMIEALGEEAKRSRVPPAAVEELQAQEATLEARSQQAARRDEEVADQIDGIHERMDAERRYGPPLPAGLKELFLPSGTLESPLSIHGQFRFLYSQVEDQPGMFEMPSFSPYFLLQLNQDWLLATSLDIGGDGSVDVGEAQFNWFVNDWLTVVGGRYITPIGFFNERLNHEWINRLPDEPLMFRQVSPQITTDGVEIRGSSYLFGSPVKMEYMFYGGNGFQLEPSNPPGLADVADLGAISGGADLLNANAVGGRLGLWIPALGLTGGVSGFHNSHYLLDHSDSMEIWQTDFGWRKGNWDVRFESAHNFQQAVDIIGRNIEREGMYTQLAYRPYDAANRFLAKTEFVYRFSTARFHGLDPAAVAAALPNTVDAPVDRNQHTIGINYWFYHAMVWKFAYEINEELHGLNFRDDMFLSQFVWAF